MGRRDSTSSAMVIDAKEITRKTCKTDKKKEKVVVWFEERGEEEKNEGQRRRGEIHEKKSTNRPSCCGGVLSLDRTRLVRH